MIFTLANLPTVNFVILINDRKTPEFNQDLYSSIAKIMLMPKTKFIETVILYC